MIHLRSRTTRPLPVVRTGRRDVIVAAASATAVLFAARQSAGSGSAFDEAAAAVNGKVIEASGGYQVTEHVLRYYEATRS